MSNTYRPSTSTGTISSWKRAVRVEITSPVNGNPSFIFSEEIATELPDNSVVTQPSTSVSISIQDMTVNFNIVDPTSGNTTGTMSYEQLANALYSLYLSLALQRDQNSPSGI